jgi:DNA recombination protein RmuC
MAEDVLRLAGLIEGVNYLKQETGPEGGRPDYTFLLPADRRINMDVKFPLANYLKVLDAPDDPSRDAATTQFLRDVRARVREVTSRAYIDPTQGTVDFVLVFIPNEQIYGFIHEHDNALLDEAMKSRVVLCSPLTLYAVLAVVRQSAENFRLEQASSKILALLAEFKKQWDKYVEQMDRMGDRLESAIKTYEELKGVRSRQLERQLDKIEDLRADQDRLLTAPPQQDDA